MNDKEKKRKIEEILVHHLMTLELPIERWEVQDRMVIVQWMVGNEIREVSYKI